ncbi:MAG TPA: sulfatase [Isosphaeraceae bacterium]|nr:sulfatase [Isosphaeraceae bacterium]
MTVASLVLATVMLAGTSASEPARPNVLFIAVDDLNDWIGPLGGNAQTVTPNYDRLARLGMTFTNAHCAAPACHPSRLSVMTGVHPARSRILANIFQRKGPTWREGPDSGRGVLKEAVTLSQHFRNHGYRAVGGGKIYHALQWNHDSLNDPETWDDYFPDALDPIPHWVRPNLVDDSKTDLTPGRPLGGSADRQYFGAAPLEVADEKTSDSQVVDWAISELKAEHDRPFFLAVGLFRPHIPWEVPQEHFDRFPIDQVRVPEVQENDLNDAFDHGRRSWHAWVQENHLWDDLTRGYLASIHFNDHQIGRLLDALEASGHADDTILVMWADHGMHIGEKENWEKFTLWEESTRVPLFLVAPGVTGPGSRCSSPVSLIDIYPTLSALCGLPIPDQCDGESLVPLLQDPEKERSAPVVTSYQFHQTDDRGKVVGHAVRSKDWRYIRYDNGFEELYDHRNDPDEWTNVASDPKFSKVKQALANHLPAWK